MIKIIYLHKGAQCVWGNPQVHNRIVNGLSIAGNNLFIASSYFHDIYNPLYPDDTNSIKVIKMDTSFNTLWDVNIGWEAHFIDPAVQATRDGGCLVSAMVWDADTMKHGAYIVLFKLDANGNVTGIQRIEDMAIHTLKPYPNPGSDYFYLDIPPGNFILQVINQEGKLLAEQSLTMGRNKIDMNHYSSGIYYLRLFNKQNRIAGFGKWIKR